MNRKILYIEDNEQNLYLVTFLLERHGYQVCSATDGLQGITMAAVERPDLILLDIQLPGMDGYAVARTLRSNVELAETAIVAVTSYAMAGDREKAMAAGCNGYIEKPINPDTFLQQVEQHLPPQGVTE
ncbi:response regulator [Trichlorobacter lovleyi]|uniref:response regulator n=1 Tax=Trichlorobacter lovleyi TaxID=313985 RepID=UPI0023F4EEAD|nr:response regulator [Trichlorobacter lovleyi]